MAAPITVVVQTTDDLAVAELMASLDAQTLAYADFRVLFLVDQRATALLDRLGAVAERRPNVEVVTTSGDPDRVFSDTLSGVSEGWVLPIGAAWGPTPRLLPRALERLAAFGEEHDLGVVVGRHRPASDTEPVPSVLRSDQPLVGLAPSPELAPIRLIRVGGSDRTGIAGRGCAVVGLSTPDAQRLVPTPAETPSGTASWVDGRLRLVVAAAAGEQLELSVSHESGEDYWLSTRSAGEHTTGELDVGTAAGGGPLAPGIWRVFVHGYAADGTPTRRQPFPAVRLAPAAVQQTLVAPLRRGGGLALDVGATRTPVIRRLVTRKTTVVESARGHLFTARLSRLHSFEPAEFAGSLLLGRFELPARLVVAPGDTRVECWVSGPPGRSAIALRFGAATAATPVGLTLRIANGGPTTVVKTPTATAPTATGAAAKKATPRPAARPVTLGTRARRGLRRLRRHLPLLGR